MPSVFGDGLMLSWADDRPLMLEPFNLGSADLTMVEPFDILGTVASLTVVEPFWILGGVSLTMVEPFDLGETTSLTMVEPFDILGPTDFVLGAVDLGDGDLTVAEAAPLYGYWVPDEDEFEDLGTVTGD